MLEEREWLAKLKALWIRAHRIERRFLFLLEREEEGDEKGGGKCETATVLQVALTGRKWGGVGG